MNVIHPPMKFLDFQIWQGTTNGCPASFFSIVSVVQLPPIESSPFPRTVCVLTDGLSF